MVGVLGWIVEKFRPTDGSAWSVGSGSTSWQKPFRRPQSPIPYPVHMEHDQSLDLDKSFLPISSLRIIPFLPPRLPSSHAVNSSPPSTSFSSSSLRHLQICANSGSTLPSTVATIFSPITGKNLKPCPLPPVAINRDWYRGWWVMRKSPVGLDRKVSLTAKEC